MNILIIEDDEVWRQQIDLMLEELPTAQIDFANTLVSARLKISTNTPDLVITDIVLADGLIFELFGITPPAYPVVFMTSYASHQLLDRALLFPKTAFIIKPFHTLTLIAAIKALTKKEILIAGDSNKKLKVLGKYRQIISIPYDNIIYIEADSNYVKIYTIDKMYSYKSSLKDILVKLDDHFLQIHKSFVINTNYVKRMNLSMGVVYITAKSLPIGRAYRKQAVEKLSKVLG